MEKRVAAIVCVFDGDIYKAYDSVNHTVGIQRLLQKGFKKFTVAAFFREIRRATSTIKAGAVVSSGITRTRSLCQGGLEAPKIFNLILDEDLVWFNKKCQSWKWGVEIEPGKRVGALCFADNCWLLAHSPSTLSKMATAFINRLQETGFHVPLEDCKWCSPIRAGR